MPPYPYQYEKKRGRGKLGLWLKHAGTDTCIDGWVKLIFNDS